MAVVQLMMTVFVSSYIDVNEVAFISFEIIGAASFSFLHIVDLFVDEGLIYQPFLSCSAPLVQKIEELV